jgi:hypothetical protein
MNFRDEVRKPMCRQRLERAPCRGFNLALLPLHVFRVSPLSRRTSSAQCS